MRLKPVMRVDSSSHHCHCPDRNCPAQEVHGEKTAEPEMLRHTGSPPLPKCDKSSQGQTGVPEDTHTWKGSTFSVSSNKVANWESSGYGALLQTPSVPFPPLILIMDMTSSPAAVKANSQRCLCALVLV